MLNKHENAADIFAGYLRRSGEFNSVQQSAEYPDAKTASQSHLRRDGDVASRSGRTGESSLLDVEQSHADSIKSWIEGGCDASGLDALGDTPMHNAVNMGSLGVFRRRFDFVSERYFIMEPQEQRSRMILPLTHRRGVNDITPLHYAAMNGDEELLELLLKHGADIGALNSKVGWMPLHYAPMSGEPPSWSCSLQRPRSSHGWTT